jgi:putative ABC transport system permease protein
MLVMRQAAVPVLAGLAFGTGGALAVARGLSALLYGVTATDPGTFVAMLGLLGGAAGLGAYLPARRAARTDPMAALRCE